MLEVDSMDLTANSAMSANAPMTYENYVNNVYGPQTDSWNKGYNLLERFGNWFDGSADKSRDAYNAYLVQNNREYELGKINDARAWDEYMDSTKYQRMAKDLQAAGLNPAAVIMSGIGASGQPSSPTGNYSSGSAAERIGKKESKVGQYATQLATTAIRAIAMIAAFA